MIYSKYDAFNLNSDRLSNIKMEFEESSDKIETIEEDNDKYESE